MQEREFFVSDNVYISLTRFVVFGQTYAMSGVTSVKAREVPPSRGGPLLLALFGIICLFVGGMTWILLGIFILGVAGYICYLQESDYFVLLSTSSGEVKALKSQDRQYVEDVMQALNDCIVARG